MSIAGSTTLSASVLAALQAASTQMDQAASSIASGDLDGDIQASFDMSSAKLMMGVAGALARVDSQLSASTLDILA